LHLDDASRIEFLNCRLGQMQNRRREPARAGKMLSPSFRRMLSEPEYTRRNATRQRRARNTVVRGLLEELIAASCDGGEDGVDDVGEEDGGEEDGV